MTSHMRPAILTLVLLVPISAKAQTFDAWIDEKLKAAQDSKAVSSQNAVAAQNVTQNSKGVDRQKESPAATDRSSSLVDQSSASDFLSIAASVIPVSTVPSSSGVSSGSSSSSTTTSGGGTGTATVSTYALLSALNKKGLTDPQFYSEHVNARRFFVTAGTASSVQATDNTSATAKVFGGKILLINGREIFKVKNQDLINKKVVPALEAYGRSSTTLRKEIQEMLARELHPTDDVNTALVEWVSDSGANFEKNVLPKISAATLSKIDAMISSSFAPVAAQAQSTLEDVYDQISKAAQMSIAYTADIRSGTGYNDHQCTLIFDSGLNNSLNWTMNFSGTFTDRKGVMKNSAGGKGASEFQWSIAKSPVLSSTIKSPITFSMAAEGAWATKQLPQYTGQIKLTVPLTAGIDFPISYRYQNKVAQTNRSASQTAFGLSFDLGAVTKALISSK